MSLSEEQRKKLYDEHAMDGAHQQSYNSRDAGGFKGIFDREKCQKYGVNFWKPQAGEHLIDILPYLSGENAPYVDGVKAKPDSPAYVVDIYVHQRVNVNNDQYICLTKSYRKPCPICEAMEKGDYSAEELDEMRPKRRTIYAIMDLDATSKGIQIWELAHWFMEKKLQYRAKRPRGGGYVNYSHAKNGKSIAFSITGSGLKKAFEGHDFIDRDGPIDEEILAKVPCLDDLLHIPEYDEVKRAFESMQEEEPEEKQERGPEPERTMKYAPEPEHEHPGDKEEVKEGKPDEGNKCPIGVTFGADFDQYEDCDECVVRVECKREKEGPPKDNVTPMPRRRKKE